MTPHVDRALPGMTYCATHHRLFPHPFVGWLTPHRIAGLALVPARCDRCFKEYGDEILEYSRVKSSNNQAREPYRNPMARVTDQFSASIHRLSSLFLSQRAAV